MRIKLRWVLGLPLGLLALDVLAIYVAASTSGHAAADSAYWGTIVSWLFEAGLWVGTIGSALALLCVLPVVLVVRAERRRPLPPEPRLRDTSERERGLAQRLPRV
jgi:hypothetical protein